MLNKPGNPLLQLQWMSKTTFDTWVQDTHLLSYDDGL